MTSFLLAHCGGGQDKPGCLGPSAKLPRRFFCSSWNLVTSRGSEPSTFNFQPSTSCSAVITSLLRHLMTSCLSKNVTTIHPAAEKRCHSERIR
jgi:hypothetical protein